MNTSQATAFFEPPDIDPSALSEPSQATKPLYKILFGDDVGTHFKMWVKTSESVHVIDTRLAAKVSEMAEKWPEKLTCSNSHLTSGQKIIQGQAIFQIS